MKKLGLAGLALVLALGSGVKAADWPQFLGPDRNGISKETGLAVDFSKDGPKVAWTLSVGPGFASPCVAGSEVFILDRVGDKKDVLRDIDLNTGKETWSFSYDAPGKTQYDGSRAVPAVDDKQVYSIGPFGNMYAVDRKTGKEVWKLNLLTDFDNRVPMWGVSQSPLLYKDTVIVAPAGPNVGLTALKKSDGSPVWKSAAVGGMTYSSPMLINIGGVDQVVYTSFLTQQTSKVVGLDAATGKVLWNYRKWGVMWPIPGAMTLGEGKLLLTAEYGAGTVIVQVKKSESGDFRVSEVANLSGSGKALYASQIHQPFLIDDYLYFVSNGFDRSHGLVCMDLKGTVKWQTNNSPNFDLGGSLLCDGKLFLMDGKTGQLVVVQPTPEKFTPLASFKIGQTQQCWAPLVISDGRLLLRDQKQLYCLDLRPPGK